MDARRSIRDVFAVVQSAPAGSPVEVRVRQNEDLLCNLTIPAGSAISNMVDGFVLPILESGACISLDITAQGSVLPGRDLTVTIRL
jgi:hypothetical protein